MQSGPSLFCLSLRRLAILLTRARSHLVVTLSVRLRCDLKRGRQRECIFVGISEKWCRREEDRRRDNSWNSPNQGSLGFSRGTGTNCAVSGCLFNTMRVNVDLLSRGISSKGDMYGYGASYQHVALDRAAVLLIQTPPLASLLIYSAY